MKKLLSLLFLGLLSCGSEHHYHQTQSYPGGFFYLDGPSSVNCIYLDEKAPNIYNLTSECQSLVTINPQNGTYGQFPTITATNLIVYESAIRFSRVLNFTSGHDLENDANGQNILGRRRVDIVVQFKQDGLEVKMDVYRNDNFDNLNEIVASRVFKEL